MSALCGPRFKFVRLSAVQAAGYRPNEQVTYIFRLSHALVVIKLTCLCNIHPYVGHSNVGYRPTLVYLLQLRLILVGLIPVNLAFNDAPGFSGQSHDEIV